MVISSCQVKWCEWQLLKFEKLNRVWRHKLIAQDLSGKESTSGIVACKSNRNLSSHIQFVASNVFDIRNWLYVNNYQSYYGKCLIFMVMKLDHNENPLSWIRCWQKLQSIHLGQYEICVSWHCALIYIYSIWHLNQSRYVSNSSYDKMCTLSLSHTGVSKYVVFKTKVLS